MPNGVFDPLDQEWARAEQTAVRVPPRLPKNRTYAKPLSFILGKVPASVLETTPRHLHLMLFLLTGFARLGDRSGTFKLRTKDLERFGWSPTTWRRQLREMEGMDLISVSRRPGCTPVITLIEELRPDWRGGAL